MYVSGFTTVYSSNFLRCRLFKVSTTHKVFPATTKADPNLSA